MQPFHWSAIDNISYTFSLLLTIKCYKKKINWGRNYYTKKNQNLMTGKILNLFKYFALETEPRVYLVNLLVKRLGLWLLDPSNLPSQQNTLPALTEREWTCAVRSCHVKKTQRLDRLVVTQTEVTQIKAQEHQGFLATMRRKKREQGPASTVILNL